MNNKKKIIILSVTLIILLIIVGGFTYALFSERVEGNKKYTIVSGNLSVILDESKTLNDVLQENSIPIADSKGKSLDSFKFSLVNNEDTAMTYSIYIVEDEVENRTPSNDFKYFLKRDFNNREVLEYLDTVDSREKKLIETDTIPANATYNYELRLWIADTAGNEILGTSYSCHLEVEATQNIKERYVDTILNGNDPVLQEPLVPVNISKTGVVTKASLNDNWYDYDNNIWANAVILKDESKQYLDNQIIPESAIESYFVWIPKYDYQIFNMGNYNSLTTLTDAAQVINVRFSNKNTVDNDTECAYPIENNQAVSGASFDNCNIGKWMTHPAFTTMDVKGFWVGKFETGYDGATSAEEAQQDLVDTSKIIVKPNVYSWRNITIGKMFKNSYDYKRSLNSHMMKNTEWGAMAYLSASKYGYKDEISTGTKRTTAIINNNSAYITGYAATEEPTVGHITSSIAGNRQESTILKVDGTYTKNYLNTYSGLASTTGNYSGIYDTSGGALEYVAGYTTGASTVGGASGITSLYSNFFSDVNYYKYWDKYLSTANTNYNKRILGDATGEMGPFQSTTDPDTYSRYKSSWNNDYGWFVYSSGPWFGRSGFFTLGIEAGSFAFTHFTGEVYTGVSFRIVLSPKEVQ